MFKDMKKDDSEFHSFCRPFSLEAPPGFEPGLKDLQSHALPLGYGAI